MAAASGTYFALIPVKTGVASEDPPMILNVSAGIVDRQLDGALSNFKVSLPVLVTLMISLRAWTVLTDSGPAQLVLIII